MYRTMGLDMGPARGVQKVRCLSENGPFIDLHLKPQATTTKTARPFQFISGGAIGHAGLERGARGAIVLEGGIASGPASRDQ